MSSKKQDATVAEVGQQHPSQFWEAGSASLNANSPKVQTVQTLNHGLEALNLNLAKQAYSLASDSYVAVHKCQSTGDIQDRSLNE